MTTNIGKPQSIQEIARQLTKQLGKKPRVSLKAYCENTSAKDYEKKDIGEIPNSIFANKTNERKIKNFLDRA